MAKKKAYQFEVKGIVTLVIIIFALIILSLTFGFLMGVKMCNPSPTTETKVEQKASDTEVKSNDANKSKN